MDSMTRFEEWVPEWNQLGVPYEFLPPQLPLTHVALFDVFGNPKTLEAIEKEVIEATIKYLRGQMSEVARTLKIGRSTLYRKLDQYAIPFRA